MFLYLFAAIFSTSIKNMLVVVVGGILNTILNYLFNHYWTFNDRKEGVKLSVGGFKFFIATGITIGIYALLVWLFNNAGMDPRLSVLVATIISFFPKYAMCYFWVWGKNAQLLEKPSKRLGYRFYTPLKKLTPFLAFSKRSKSSKSDIKAIKGLEMK
jgi:putative flippase GtrA